LALGPGCSGNDESSTGRQLDAGGAGGARADGSGVGQGGTPSEAGGLRDASVPNPASGGGSPDAETCDAPVARRRPASTVLVVLDQSSSMNEQFPPPINLADPPNPTRWDSIKRALVDPSTGVLEQYESELRLGLMLFSGDGGFAAGECPLLTSAPVTAGGLIDFDVGNFDAISAVLSPAEPIEDTPTSESLEAAARALEAFDAPGSKRIVLCTDGEPDTCENPAANFDPASVERTVDTVSSIYDRGIRTEIVAVGFDTDSFAQAVANAGAGAGPTGAAPYYAPVDQAELVAAFESILGRAAGCEVALGGTVVGDPAAGTVVLDGQALELDAPNGWRLVSPSTIELGGTACATASANLDDLSVTFPCGAFEAAD
jgi:hypothetical protein